MKRPFSDKRIIGPLSQRVGGGDVTDKEYYQEQFSQRMVSATKHGVQDPIEEIEYFVDTIKDIPWKDFTAEQRVAIATPAISAIKTVFQVSAEQGQIEERMVSNITSKFSMLLFDYVSGAEPQGLVESGLGLIKMNIRGDLD